MFWCCTQLNNTLLIVGVFWGGRQNLHRLWSGALRWQMSGFWARWWQTSNKTDLNLINELKPIPIQPDERETPLINKGESARPPPTQPSPYQEQKSRNEEKQEAIQKALDYAEKHPQYPAPDDATSNTQSSNSKSGYCYIGEDRGFRSCIQVSPNVQCMSGDIFPTMDICVNQNLRI